jgi:hypothetical protein
MAAARATNLILRPTSALYAAQGPIAYLATLGLVARAGSTVTNLMLACTIATNAPFQWLLVMVEMTVTSAKRLDTELGRIGMDRRHGTMVSLLTVTRALKAPIRYMQT